MSAPGLASIPGSSERVYEKQGMSVTSVIDHMVRWLLPAPCLGCGVDLPGHPPSPLGLCAACRGRLVRHPAPGRGACLYCARPWNGARLPPEHRCGGCRRSPPAYERLVVGWRYRSPLAEVVQALKFRRLEYLGPQLGRRLASAVAPDLPPVDAVVPVPLHWWRHLRRGYNQAELVARAVADTLDVPCHRWLSRPRPTPAQSGLSRERRRRNLRGAFRCRYGVEGRRLLLVDDVVTTGATLEAAAACLQRAGARASIALAAARTPRDGELTPWTPQA